MREKVPLMCVFHNLMKEYLQDRYSASFVVTCLVTVKGLITDNNKESVDHFLQRPKLQKTWESIPAAFYCVSSYASTVLAVVILSVRLSVCHTRALWQNHSTMHCGYFDTTRKRNDTSFQTPTVVGGWRPLQSKICSQWPTSLRNAPTLTDFRFNVNGKR